MTRLPTPGGDDGKWGDILNDFLSVEHNGDGSLKSVARPADLAAKYSLPGGGIPKSDLSNGVQISLDKADTPAIAIAQQTGSSYTLALSDAGGIIRMSSSSSQTLVIPNDSQINFPVGTMIEILRAGTATVTVSATSPVTVRTTAGGMTVTPQWGRVSLLKLAANEWHVDGSLA